MTEENTSKLFVLSACLIWGIFFPLWKILLETVPPLSVLSFYSPLAATLLFLCYRMPIAELSKTLRAHFFHFIGLAVCGGIFGGVLIFFAMTKLNSGIAAVVLYLQPLFTIVVARVFLKEILSTRQLLFGVAALFFASLVAVDNPLDLQNSSLHVLGLLAGVASAASYGVATVFARSLALRGVAARHIAFFRMGLASVILLPLATFSPSAGWDFAWSSKTITLLTLVTIGPGTLAFLLYFRGLQSLRAGVANLLELITPIIALIMGSLVLGETYTNSQLLAVPGFLFCIWHVSR